MAIYPIRSTDILEVYRTGSMEEGHVVIFHKMTSSVDCSVDYLNETVLDMPVTRIKVRKSTKRFSTLLFFDILLPRWPLLISDAEPDESFWRIKLIQASHRSSDVGIYENEHLEWWNGRKAVDKWLDQPWSKHRRFLIKDNSYISQN